MPKMMLTDEEKRLIEQRRLMENRHNLGYNEALRDVGSCIEEMMPDAIQADGIKYINPVQLRKMLDGLKKAIRP